MEEQKRYGIPAGQEVLSTGDRWPRLRPQAGDRARFHFLTTGNDPWFVATKFHRVGEGPKTKDVVCLHSLTFGEEDCGLCGMDVYRRNMFACWIWLDCILHPQDNPDDSGNSWPQKQLDLGDGNKRTVFVEEIGGASRLLWLPAGKGQAWFSQFSTAWMQHGDLRKHSYELYRVGKGRDDTDYTLRTLKEDPTDSAILELSDVESLPDIETVFRETVRFSAAPTNLGTDSLDGSPVEEEPEPMPSAAPPTADSDDLI